MTDPQAEAIEMEDFSDVVAAALGIERADRLVRTAKAFEQATCTLPQTVSYVAHLPVPLKARDMREGARETAELLRRHDPVGAWFFYTSVREDGSRVAFASDLYHQRPHEPLSNQIVGFLFFDLSTLFGAWWVTHCWRAASLMDAVIKHLATWNVIAAACCARSLLEGAAALAIEGEQMLDAWLLFKRSGKPSINDATSFRATMMKSLTQVLFGTRIEELTRDHGGLKRTNILTLVNKLARRHEGLAKVYEWLCGAVHPSFGFGTVYVTHRGVHKSGAILATDLARTAAAREDRRVESTVARCTADASVTGVEEAIRLLPAMRWMAFDLALTSGAGVASPGPFVGSVQRVPERNEQCPCQSGRKFKQCGHSWGARVGPPVLGNGQNNIAPV